MNFSVASTYYYSLTYVRTTIPKIGTIECQIYTLLYDSYIQILNAELLWIN